MDPTSRPRAAARSRLALSVVLPVYNGERTIGAQLDALAAQRWDESWELVVADNGSTDRTREIVERFRGRIPRLRIVDALGRRGPAHASNRGADSAHGRSLAFCDADDVAGAGWVAAIGRALARHEFVASRHELCELNPRWLVRSRGAGQTAGLPSLWYPPYCPHAGGCGLGIRRSLFREIGGFDENLMYLHDTDLCVRLFLHGTELRFIPDAVIHVRYRSGLRGVYRQSRVWSEYNVLLYYRYRDTGEPIPDAWRAYGRAWQRLARNALKARTRSDVVRLVRGLGKMSGLLRGSLRYGIEPAIACGPTRRRAERRPASADAPATRAAKPEPAAGSSRSSFDREANVIR